MIAAAASSSSTSMASAALRRPLSHTTKAAAQVSSLSRRGLATPVSAATSGSGSLQHRVLVVGGGAAGQAISHQLARSGVFANPGDIAIIDPKKTHDYQPGWTLVGAGLKTKEELRRPMSELAGNGDGLQLYEDAVESFDPDTNTVKTRDGKTISYEHLVVVPGLGQFPEKIAGLKDALADPAAKVASIYDYNSCDTVWDYIQEHKAGPAIFTQPPQPHKCAGAPQKIMWLALDHWKTQGVRSDIPITYATALPAMFAVPKYSQVLEELRKERDVEGLFGHNLTSIEGSTATFTKSSGGEKVTRPFNFLHVTPPQGPLDFIRNSPLADPTSGFVSVDQGTTQHTKYPNVWSAGDSSSLPTSKTAAAITAEAPVLVANLIRSVLKDTTSQPATYDGYTSCPLLTEYGKVLLAEFKYGGQPKETFNSLFGIDQAQPSRAFYHLKKDFFPWVYYNSYVKGTWAGPKGWSTGNGLASGKTPGGTRAFSTSARAHRDTESRRPKDPLDSDPTAVRHKLDDGATFIVRPAPSSGYSHVVGSEPTPSGDAAVPVDILSYMASPHEAAGDAPLPPPLRPNTRRTDKSGRPKREDLTSAEIAEIQRLRAEDPAWNSPIKLARQFNCSQAFVRIVAPASKEWKKSKEQEKQEHQMTSMSFNKLLRKVEKAERRKMW